MRLAVMGSPDFAVPTLDALHGAGHDIAAVYCQPPRPAGRGQAPRPCPMQRRAEALGLPVRTPARLRGIADEWDRFASLDLDAAIVAAYGLILPGPMLQAPRRGCLNVHASLLPRWRGASPIQAALLAGDDETGISIMRMDEGLDTGPVLLRAAIPLDGGSDAAGVHDRLAALGAALVLRALGEDPQPEPQPGSGASYAPKLAREDGRLDWSQPAAALERRVRALNPWPGTWTVLRDEPVKVLAAKAEPGCFEPGRATDDRLGIGCGEGVLRLARLQRPGRAALDAEAFLRGRPVPPGSALG